MSTVPPSGILIGARYALLVPTQLYRTMLYMLLAGYLAGGGPNMITSSDKSARA